MANCSGCPYRWHDSDCEYCSVRGDIVLDGTHYSKDTCTYYKEYEKSKGSSSGTSSSASGGGTSKGCVIAFIIIALILVGYVFGPKLYKQITGRNLFAQTETKADNTEYPVPQRNLSPGAEGDDVRWLQASLTKLGYDLKTDGSYGETTTAAVKQFQSDNGLEADGLAGPVTQEKIISMLKEAGK